MTTTKTTTTTIILLGFDTIEINLVLLYFPTNLIGIGGLKCTVFEYFVQSPPIVCYFQNYNWYPQCLPEWYGNTIDAASSQDHWKTCWKVRRKEYFIAGNLLFVKIPSSFLIRTCKKCNFGSVCRCMFITDM